jgi:hypothetical protein
MRLTEQNIPCGDDSISASSKKFTAFHATRRTTAVFTRNFTVLTNIFTGDAAVNIMISA